MDTVAPSSHRVAPLPSPMANRRRIPSGTKLGDRAGEDSQTGLPQLPSWTRRRRAGGAQAPRLIEEHLLGAACIRRRWHVTRQPVAATQIPCVLGSLRSPQVRSPSPDPGRPMASGARTSAVEDEISATTTKGNSAATRRGLVTSGSTDAALRRARTARLPPALDKVGPAQRSASQDPSLGWTTCLDISSRHKHALPPKIEARCCDDSDCAACSLASMTPSLGRGTPS